MIKEIIEIAKDLKTYLEFERISGIKDIMTGDDNLSSAAGRLIFSNGSMSSRLLFLGHASSDEYISGMLPYGTDRGALLKKIIEAMGLKARDVSVVNIDQDINNYDIDYCKKLIIDEIDKIKPEVICLLGSIASRVFLGVNDDISILRGKFYNYNKINVMPTFHPEHLLSNTGDKRLVWEDVKKIRDLLSNSKLSNM